MKSLVDDVLWTDVPPAACSHCRPTSRAGADTARAAECATAPVEDARFERIARGLQFGIDLAVKGTPTFVIDGRVQGVPPGLEVLSRLTNR